MRNRPRIAIVHPVPVWHGGAEAVALWTLEALASEYSVTVVAYGEPPDFVRLDRCFGTRVAAADFGWRRIPIPKRALAFRGPFDIAWRYLTMAWCRRACSGFDLLVSTFYEMDLGRPAVQYCHCPMYVPTRARPSHVPRLRHAAWEAYRGAASVISGFRPERVRRNLTLANSDWTRRALVPAYGNHVRTLYPPVRGARRQLPWHERTNAFVCIGRLVPEKRFDAVIRILEALREQGEDVRLHLVVSSPEPEYERRVEAMAAARSAWVRLEREPSRERLLELSGSNRYGIHAREAEHFGIAPAELAASGAIVFVHDSGGQVEIAPDPRLRFTSEADAVEKILAVLRDADTQAQLRALLARRAADFLPERFMSAMRAVVRESLSDTVASRSAVT